MAIGLTPSDFARKWLEVTGTERATAQEHFLDLCRMLGVETPNEADPTGGTYSFERGAAKSKGGDGWADVWKRGHFGWEYKGKRKDLNAAYQQLNQYREDLGNPPLLVVCDLHRFEVHTNFTDTPKEVHRFDLNDLASNPERPLQVLRAVMSDPEKLRPKETPATLTEKAAGQFADLARALRERGFDPQRVAHFLNKLLFSMFAEDVGLLPEGLLRRLADGARRDPDRFTGGLKDLFGKMSKDGGLFGTDLIPWFNGGLFDGDDVLPLTKEEIATVAAVSDLDWSAVEPAIFGTLFERGLDPGKRGQLGAHYTDRASIWRLVEPVVLVPLRRDLEATKVKVRELLAAGGKITARTPEAKDPFKTFAAFLGRLRNVRVLDPACGSGNFLYVALQALKDLELEALNWAHATFKDQAERVFAKEPSYPVVGPTAMRGIEINVFAAELARLTIWIGHLQWLWRKGYLREARPILDPLNAIECRDALLDLSNPTLPVEAQWPDATFIVGNPPFLGGKLLRRNLGDSYVDALFKVFDGRASREADFVTYWFEKARSHLEQHRAQRVGLLATQGIRGGANREVLERIAMSGGIFSAWSDEPWVLDGAAVHVSFVAFDDGSEQHRTLDGHAVAGINANLTSGVDLTRARRLRDNLGIAFMGDTKGGTFELNRDAASALLASPNPDGRSNADVVVPWINGQDVGGSPRHRRIIDFGTERALDQAALYEQPFQYLLRVVQPERGASKTTIREWWLHERPRVEMRNAIRPLARFIATIRHSRHRLFVWVPAGTLPDSALIVFARDDDLTMGLLHSRPHELWARGTGTQVREVESGFRYTPTTCFETYPFPKPTAKQRQAIEREARDLVRLREGWLNPPGADAATLKKRTLTNLYNERPTWLAKVHARLDAAVLDAYGWPHEISDDDLLARLLNLNLEREPVGGEPTPTEPARAESQDGERSKKPPRSSSVHRPGQEAILAGLVVDGGGRAGPRPAIPEGGVTSALDWEDGIRDDASVFGLSVCPSEIGNAEEDEDNWDTVHVYYGTNRRPTGRSEPHLYYGSELDGDKLHVGHVEVTIPERHKISKVERPKFLVRLRLDRRKHVMILEHEEWTEETLFEGNWLMPRTMVYVHGYNVGFEDAALRCAQLRHDLAYPGTVAFFSWPSLGRIGAYLKDRERAEASARALAGFLRAVRERGAVREIDIVAHSMGALVTSHALTQLGARHGSGAAPIRQIVLAAPDISRASFDQLAAQILSQVRRATLYASDSDHALMAARRLWSMPRLGDLDGGIYLRNGLDSIDASRADTNLLGHSYYCQNRSVLTDINEAVILELPPAERRVNLERLLQGAGVYWRFRA